MPDRIVYVLPAASQDLTGKTFERWTVIKFVHRKFYGKDTGHNYWSCRCSCENHTVKTVSGPSLISGLSLSCGCLRLERIKAATTTHGYTTNGVKHPLVAAHHNMMMRCYNENVASYKYYGAKGIKVEPVWHDCATFIKDMEPTWNGGFNANGEKLSIDRISSASNYGPGLCKWSTSLEQANNQRSNVVMTAAGQTMNLTQWARTVGISKAAIQTRRKLGWSDEECVLIPIGMMRHSWQKQQAKLASKTTEKSQ